MLLHNMIMLMHCISGRQECLQGNKTLLDMDPYCRYKYDKNDIYKKTDSSLKPIIEHLHRSLKA